MQAQLTPSAVQHVSPAGQSYLLGQPGGNVELEVLPELHARTMIAVNGAYRYVGLTMHSS
jgi:hypothetical protein